LIKSIKQCSKTKMNKKSCEQDVKQTSMKPRFG
jgi:hypothetical protein